MIIQFTGLSGSGKTTLAYRVKEALQSKLPIEVIDGDEYRKMLCADLSFSRKDRNQNIRRLAFVASKLSAHNIVAIICAINPYEDVRQEVAAAYPDVKTVFVSCDLETLVKRDTKGLYKKAMLPEGHPQKLHNLTGVNDPFELPLQPDLIIYSGKETEKQSAEKLIDFILSNYKHA